MAGISGLTAAATGLSKGAPRILGLLFIAGLLGGQIQMLVAAEFPPYAAAGQIRLLAETGPDKIPEYPQVPTFKELGYDLSAIAWYGLFAPAGTPSAVIERLSKAAMDTVSDPQLNKRLLEIVRQSPCQHCGIKDGTVVAAHSNQLRDGKGRSIKAHDYRIAALCHRCHYDLDQGAKLDKQQRIGQQSSSIEQPEWFGILDCGDCHCHLMPSLEVRKR